MTTDLVVTGMSKHAATLLASEAVEILVNKHVIVEAVLSGECRLAQKTHKRLYTYHTQHAYCTVVCPVWGRGTPLPPCPFTFSSFPLFTFSFLSLALPIFFFCPSLPFLPE